MKTWNEQKAYFYTDALSLGIEWIEYVCGPHRKYNHTLGGKKKGKKRKVANFAPGDVRVRMKVDR